MANQQESLQTRWCYKDTIYALPISRLVSLGTNQNAVPVVCPKVGCKTKLFLKKQLYRHIETKHPEDKLHTRNYSSSALSSLTTETTTIPNTDEIVINENEEMEFENSLYEEVPIINTQPDSYVDDYLNDEYLKVCNYSIMFYLKILFFRELWVSFSSTSTLKELRLC